MIYLTGNFSFKFRRDRLHSTRRGFTLIEMLVVLAIVVMLIGISVPFTTGFGKGLRLKTAARAVVGTLRVARSNAITYRQKYVVTFDVENGEYWIEEVSGKIFERKIRLPSSIKFEAQNEGGDPITFEDDKVIFCASGAMEGNSGLITISDKQGNAKIISIIGSTGKISID